MELILGIDTATVVCVGLASETEIIASEVVADSRAHAEQLLPLVVKSMGDHSLDELTQIAVGVGPGPFTGLRVGVAAACTLAEVLHLPIKGVCSLDVLAAQAFELPETPQSFIVACDARRKELYWAVYEAGKRIQGPFVSAPEELPALPTCGPAAQLYQLAGEAFEAARYLDAGALARIVGQLPDVGLEPLYLRRPDAEVSTKRKSVLPTVRVGSLRRKPGGAW